jgi:hypothetical protein
MAKKESDPISIDKNIPLPPRRGGGVSKYPWATMKVGDSFLATKSAVAASVSYCRHNKNVKFVSRKTDKGIRIWRVK